MFLLLAFSLFFTNPAPLDMPRASAYLVSEGEKTRLEDRFSRIDLWTSRTVDGRWVDDDERVFTLATLAVRPPAIDRDATETRSDYVAAEVPVDRKKLEEVREAIYNLTTIELAEKPEPPRQIPRSCDDVDYWQGTNTTVIVCAFRLREEPVWRLAVWQLVEGDDFAECLKLFEDQFLEKEGAAFYSQPGRRAATKKGKKRSASKRADGAACERELLRADARHSVSAYDGWRVTDAREFSVLDDLLTSESFIIALTNEMSDLRAAAAKTLPTSIDGSNVLSVARIYASRDEYQAALEVEGLTNMTWSAAYWCPLRRELVAYLPKGDTAELLKTFRHEAFHQYLSYATAMITTSPWLNEGYAQYFEDPESLDWGRGLTISEETLKELASVLPRILAMDYVEFYGGSNEARRLNYRLAWSIAVFIENGAPKVRFAPFKNLTSDYLKSLLSTHDPAKATAAAFKSKELLQQFQDEWFRWWKEQVR